jgi:putative membrane protein
MPDPTVHRLHPAWIVLRAITTLRAMALPLVIVLFTGRSSGDLIGFGVAGAIIVVTIIVRAITWWRFTYAITPQGVRAQSGLLARQDRLIPFERIQSVDLREGVLERVLGVSQVRIESAAGTEGSEIVLGAVSREQAAELRTNLLQRRGLIVSPETTSPDASSTLPATTPALSTSFASSGDVIFTVSTGSLLVAGATSSRIGPALALFAGVLQFADDILRDTWWDRVMDSVSDLTLGIVVALIIIAIVFAWIFATISAVLTFGGYELRRDGDRLLISYGLLERRRSTIPLARIQAVTISEGWLRQPFGLAVIRVESAGYGKTSPEVGVLAPIIRRKDIPSLLHRACPDYAIDSPSIQLEPLPNRARRRYVLSNLWWVLGGCAVLTALATLFPWSPWWWGALALIAAPFATIYGDLEFRDTGWAVNAADRVILRRREIDRVTAITRRTRLQERSVSQNPLQRRASLVTFRTAVASGGEGGQFAMIHLDAGTGFDLLSRLGPLRARTPKPELVSTLTTPSHDHDDS